MLIDKQRARIWLKARRATTLSWLTATQAAQVLDLEQQVVYQLIKRNLLTAQRTRGSRGWLSHIDRDEVEAFRQTYVSLATLAKAAGKALSAIGINRPPEDRHIPAS